MLSHSSHTGSLGTRMDGELSDIKEVANSEYCHIHLEGADDLVLDIANSHVRHGASVIVWHKSSKPGGAKNQVQWHTYVATTHTALPSVRASHSVRSSQLAARTHARPNTPTLGSAVEVHRERVPRVMLEWPCD